MSAISYKTLHYGIKPELLYSSECPIINKNGKWKKWEGIKKNLKEDCRAGIRVVEKITDTVHKRQLKFHGYLTRISESRLPKKIFKYITKVKATTKKNKEKV